MTGPGPFTRKRLAAVLGVLIVLGGYAVISAHFRRVGLMAPDESYYTLASRSVYQGEVPYRDFAYMQMPYLPYLNGLVMQVTGLPMKTSTGFSDSEQPE